MADDPPSSLPLDQSHVLLTSFNTFLTVAIHNILYYRSLYPPQTFLSTRAYNLPVHQNRHPKVCTWISDAVTSVAAQLATGKVSLIAVVLHSPLDDPLLLSPLSPSPTTTTIPPGSVLERYTFDTSHFPTWPTPSINTYARILHKDSRSEVTRDALFNHPSLNLTNLNEQFRGCLLKMAQAMEGLSPIPEGCTFTLAVELKDEAAAPIGHPQDWIPSEPTAPPSEPQDKKGKGRYVEPVASRAETGVTVKTTPVRVVEAGPLWFECWVEESRAKVELMERGASQGSV
ncbi:putative mitotic spindle assembly checkpoint protein M [Cercophora samala]|uniref:Mitotic spindle assembly checkpoint protein M n=1 Tax=Cercophora samala TaxID=330535 RepID=A0AA39ZK42_9PEZI|nr:putative mitotic spindle assembly checkpoint protein M [Cercophora samala]